MIKSIFLSFIFSICFICLIAQELNKEIQDGDRVVVVKNSNSMVENYFAAARVLLDWGYPIKERDKEIGFITTEIFTSHDAIGGAHFQKLLVVVQDSTIKFSTQTAVIDRQHTYDYPRFYETAFKKVAGQLGLFQPLIFLAGKIDGQVFYTK